MSDALAIRNAFNSPQDKIDDPIARVVKLVPGEAIFIYTSGYAFIDPDDYFLKWIWAVSCLLATFLLRYKTMEDPSGDKRQWLGILISCISFVIYVYGLGGPFQSVPHLWKPAAG